MIRPVRTISLFLLAAALLSCQELPMDLSGEEPEEQPLLQADLSRVTVPAEEAETAPTDRTLMITCGSSWTASLEPAVSWVNLSRTKYDNPDGKNHKALIVLSFLQYESETEDRTTTLVITSGLGTLEIPVSQQHMIPISATLEASKEAISVFAKAPEGTDFTQSIDITSNKGWTASLQPAADWVMLSQESEENETRKDKTTTLVLTFQPNASVTDSRTTTLVIETVKGGKRLEIPITQNKYEAYAQWVSTDTDYVNSAAGTLELAFQSSDNWTAALKEPVEGVSLSATGGDNSVTRLSVAFSELMGPGVTRSATIVLTSLSNTTDELTVRQIGTELSLDFTGGNQPFTASLPYYTALDGETAYTLSLNGGSFGFRFKITGGYYNKPDGQSCGFSCSKNDWVLLPAVAGMKLKTAEVYTSNTGSSANKGFALKETPDGSNQASSYVAAHDVWCTLTLNSPAAGSAYYLTALNNSAMFSKLHLVYEK